MINNISKPKFSPIYLKALESTIYLSVLPFWEGPLCNPRFWKAFLPQDNMTKTRTEVRKLNFER